MWEHLGRTAAETLQLERLLACPERFEVKGLDMVQDLLDGGRGGLFISLHSGNWELALWPLATAGLQPSVIYKPMENPLVERWMRKKRAQVYTGGLFEKDASTSRRLVGLLRDGARIGLMGDRRAGKGHVMLPFFGRPAPTSIVPARLALRLGIPLIAGRVVRRPGTRFRIECVHVTIEPTGDSHHDSIALTGKINRIFEGWIRENPAQWMWAHKRWGSETDEPPDELQIMNS
jgi:KDO2-lipid IV(A) lauroyltransferase